MYSHFIIKKNQIIFEIKAQKNNKKKEKDSIMNKLFFNNPDLLKNFRKCNSKTPNKARVKNPYFCVISNSNINTKKNSSNEMVNLKIKINHNNEYKE